SAMVFSLAGVFSRPEQLSGIIGIVNQGGSFIAGGAINIVKFTGLMSLNLAVINLLPIPSLDGGKVILCLLEKIHPRLRKLHVPMAVAGWVMILGILAYTTIIDIGRLA
ncbi:MAG TPA: membrane-associated Zn-dependent protease, partial [Spirochaetes bacterium]|nr:membrane-associated Zn-dependent protease [Spirochaetota bacterium]